MVDLLVRPPEPAPAGDPERDIAPPRRADSARPRPRDPKGQRTRREIVLGPSRWMRTERRARARAPGRPLAHASASKTTPTPFSRDDGSPPPRRASSRRRRGPPCGPRRAAGPPPRGRAVPLARVGVVARDAPEDIRAARLGHGDADRLEAPGVARGGRRARARRGQHEAREQRARGGASSSAPPSALPRATAAAATSASAWYNGAQRAFERAAPGSSRPGARYSSYTKPSPSAYAGGAPGRRRAREAAPTSARRAC